MASSGSCVGARPRPVRTPPPGRALDGALDRAGRPASPDRARRHADRAAVLVEASTASCGACPASGPCSPTRRRRSSSPTGSSSSPGGSTRSRPSSTTVSAPAWPPGCSSRSTPRSCAPVTRSGPSAATASAPHARSALLAGADPSVAAIEAFHSVQVALSAIDRLEVRGRDSAGLHLLVRHHGLDLDEPAVGRLVEARATDPLFGSGSVRATGDELAFVYKAAAEIGELGDNTAVLRAAIRDDALLHLALADDAAEVMVLGHTRWASVGIISEANAHPLNHEELDGADRPYVVGALNGDVDNYADLKALEQLQVPAEITTDAKVIPALVARRMADGADGRRRVPHHRRRARGVDGHRGADRGRARPAAPVAAGQRPGALRRAGGGRLRRRQRAVRAGRGDRHLPAHGRRDPGRPRARRRHPRPGRRARRRAARARSTASGGSRSTARRSRWTPTSSSTPRSRRATSTAATFPHFLLKEISEAPASFRKTLRARSSSATAGSSVALSPETLPDSRARPAARRQHPARRRDRPGHRRDRGPEPRRGARRLSPTTQLRAEAVARHRVLRVPAPRRHVRHARRRDQPERHHHRHQPHRRPRARARRGGRRHRQPAQQRPRRQVRRRALHVRRPRRRDGGAVDQGVLRADRRRVPPRHRHRRRGDRRPIRRASHELLDVAARRSPTRCCGCSSTAPPSPRSRSGTRVSRRYWAVVGNGRNRIAAQEVRIKALGALLQVDLLRRHRGQEAHRPLGRAPDPRVRGRAAGIERRRRRQGDRDLPRAPRPRRS